MHAAYRFITFSTLGSFGARPESYHTFFIKSAFALLFTGEVLTYLQK